MSQDPTEYITDETEVVNDDEPDVVYAEAHLVRAPTQQTRDYARPGSVHATQ